MKEYTIYRDSWVNGNPDPLDMMGSSSLLNENDRQCCLGQVLAQEGIPLEELHGQPYPSNVPVDLFPEELKTLLLRHKTDLDHSMAGPIRNSDVCSKMVLTNDTSEAGLDREGELTRIMADKGYGLTFVDGKAPWLKDWVGPFTETDDDDEEEDS